MTCDRRNGASAALKAADEAVEAAERSLDEAKRVRDTIRREMGLGTPTKPQRAAEDRLSVQDIVAEYGVHEQTAYRIARERGDKSLGGRWLVPRSALGPLRRRAG